MTSLLGLLPSPVGPSVRAPPPDTPEALQYIAVLQCLQRLASAPSLAAVMLNTTGWPHLANGRSSLACMLPALLPTSRLVLRSSKACAASMMCVATACRRHGMPVERRDPWHITSRTMWPKWKSEAVKCVVHSL